MIDEMSKADPSQVEASLTARIETHRGLEMLDRQIRLAGKQPQPAAPIPSIGKARIEKESAIDQGEGRIDILAETPEHYGGAAKDTRVIGGGTQGLAGKINRRTAVCRFLAIIGPVVVFKVDPVGRCHGESETIARFTGNRLLKRLERLSQILSLIGRGHRAGS